VAGVFQKTVQEWTKGLSRHQAMITVFRKVRDIPYGVIDSRDPLKVLAANKGTCSGKHLLLAGLYRSMGLVVHDMVVFHKYRDLPRMVEYPHHLKLLLHKGHGIPDYHNFIKLSLKGTWITLDATFEDDLKDHFVVNEWDGRSDTRLSVKPIRAWEVKDPVGFKLTKLAEMPSEIQNCRKEFLGAFSDWLVQLRERKGSGAGG
jgi:hypothetical protein